MEYICKNKKSIIVDRKKSRLVMDVHALYVQELKISMKKFPSGCADLIKIWQVSTN